MKNLFIFILISLSFNTAFSKPNDQKMALKLANLLLRQEVSKCIQDAGFRGTKLLTHASAVSISEKNEVTTFKIRIERYEILPTDGTRLASTMDLILQSTLIRTRAGHDQAVTCSLVDFIKQKN